MNWECIIFRRALVFSGLDVCLNVPTLSAFITSLPSSHLNASCQALALLLPASSVHTPHCPFHSSGLESLLPRPLVILSILLVLSIFLENPVVCKLSELACLKISFSGMLNSYPLLPPGLCTGRHLSKDLLTWPPP